MNAEQQTEWNYRKEEFLANLIGEARPTPEQTRMAEDAADDAIGNLAFEV